MRQKQSLLFLFIIILITTTSCSNPNNKVDVETRNVCFINKCIDTEVRDTPSEREVGLMGRKSLTDDEGMLFIFEQSAPYKFWMKNMLMPIDIIWIDKNGFIVHIEREVPACKKEPCPLYTPSGNSLYVVETTSGFSSRYNLMVGDTVNLG